MLDDSSSDRPLDIGEARRLTELALSEAGVRFSSISSSRDLIIVEDERPDRAMAGESSLFTCPHCGFITNYEEEYWNHLKIHYIGF